MLSISFFVSNLALVMLNIFMYYTLTGEHSGSVVECLTRDQGAAGSSLTGVAVLCPSARHINPCLVLVQPRKTCPDIPEDVKNQIKQTNVSSTLFPKFYLSIPVVSFYFHLEWKTVWILIRWLHQKPPDLNPTVFS